MPAARSAARARTSPATGSRARSWRAIEGSLGDVGLVARREIRERVRGRIFRVGTLIILLAVGAAIVIPTLHSGGGPTTQTVGVVGGLSPETEQVVDTAGSRNQDSVKLVPEPSLAAAKADLRSGKVDLAIVDGDQVLLNQPATLEQLPGGSRPSSRTWPNTSAC